jgi:hypothetical protein
MARIKVITAYDDKFASVGDISARSIAVYATLNKLDYGIFPIPSTERPASWGKLKLILDIFKENDSPDFVFWVDADACFVRFDENISRVIKDDKDFYLVSHVFCRFSVRHGVYLAVDRPNMGVFMIRKSEWSINFLNKLWSMSQYIDHPWWENAAAMDLFGYRCELTGNIESNEAIEEYLAKVEWLPLAWNSLADLWNRTKDNDGSVDPIILHYAGASMEVRQQHMSNLSAAVKLRP